MLCPFHVSDVFRCCALSRCRCFSAEAHPKQEIVAEDDASTYQVATTEVTTTRPPADDDTNILASDSQAEDVPAHYRSTVVAGDETVAPRDDATSLKEDSTDVIRAKADGHMVEKPEPRGGIDDAAFQASPGVIAAPSAAASGDAAIAQNPPQDTRRDDDSMAANPVDEAEDEGRGERV